jgi:hypothetical protein
MTAEEVIVLASNTESASAIASAARLLGWVVF